MSLFPARMKMFKSKKKAQKWSQHFSHCKPMRTFSICQGQLTLRLYVPVTRIYEENPIKNEGASVLTTLYSDISDAKGQVTP